jgi:hypothetical protein
MFFLFLFACSSCLSSSFGMLNSYDEEEDDDDNKENEGDEGYKNTKYGHGLDGEDAGS